MSVQMNNKENSITYNGYIIKNNNIIISFLEKNKIDKLIIHKFYSFFLEELTNTNSLSDIIYIEYIDNHNRLCISYGNTFKVYTINNFLKIMKIKNNKLYLSYKITKYNQLTENQYIHHNIIQNQ